MNIVRLVTNLFRQKDILLVSVFVLILLMMILPLPAMLMDALITLNISASVIIILMSLQFHSPVQFSTFPSLLLVTTLFRLAISISTTRLILIEGNAGKIVETFGEVVVGGNLVVGLVIFMIITVVQFMVITKGADRVAEVGARFTLDGMPGKQMSVDADVRAGNMDHFEAREARQNLEREAKLFGSMDGAMKFVKGDATAGLVITAINLLGGIGIGMVQRDLGFNEALELYSLMTIGDGLVSQIPALLISVAAGNMVTRVVNPKGMDLGTEISQQVSANGRTIIIAGLVIGLFGFVPGFPTVIFLIVGVSLSGGVYWGLRSGFKEAAKAEDDWDLKLSQLNRVHADIKMRTGAKEAVKLVLPISIRAENLALFHGTWESVRRNLETEFGILAGYWKLEIDDVSEEQYKIFVKQELVACSTFKPDLLFVKANPSYMEALEIPCAYDFGAREGAFVDLTQLARLREENIPFWTSTEQLFMLLKKTVIENLESLANFQSTANLLKEVQRENPVLVNDLNEALSNNQISSVIRMLLRERLPVTSLVRILEAILQWSQTQSEPAYLLQKARVAIADFITMRFAPDGFLPVVVVAPTLESCLREGMRKTDQGNFLVLEPLISTYVAKQAKDIIGDGYRRGQHPVLLAQQDVRQALFGVLHQHGIYLPVLAYQEIAPETIIYPVGYMSTDPHSAAA
jgi:type III secretion protein V